MPLFDRRNPLLILSLLLVLCLACPWCLAQGEAEEPGFEALQEQFKEAYEAGDYEKALELAEQKNELAQIDYIFTLRDVAAMHCRLGNTEQAYQRMQESLDADFDAAGLEVLRSHDFLPEQYFVEYGVE